MSMIESTRYVQVELDMGRELVGFVRVCLDCGALVTAGSTKTHDMFHSYIEGVARTAQEADSWAGAMRPLGSV